MLCIYIENSDLHIFIDIYDDNRMIIKINCNNNVITLRLMGQESEFMSDVLEQQSVQQLVLHIWPNVQPR